jgi:hypothetical protein
VDGTLRASHAKRTLVVDAERLHLAWANSQTTYRECDRKVIEVV